LSLLLLSSLSVVVAAAAMNQPCKYLRLQSGFECCPPR
jgi:hypothetical protein